MQYAIVSGGVTSQELAYYNIPMLIYPYAKNHKKTMVGLIENNLAIRVYSKKDLVIWRFFSVNFDIKNFFEKWKPIWTIIIPVIEKIILKWIWDIFEK